MALTVSHCSCCAVEDMQRMRSVIGQALSGWSGGKGGLFAMEKPHCNTLWHFGIGKHPHHYTVHDLHTGWSSLTVGLFNVTLLPHCYKVMIWNTAYAFSFLSIQILFLPFLSDISKMPTDLHANLWSLLDKDKVTSELFVCVYCTWLVYSTFFDWTENIWNWIRSW